MTDEATGTSADSIRFSLSVKNLQTLYKIGNETIRAVDGISFCMSGNEKVGIAGESGSGKTQTALSIMGLTSGWPGIVNGKIEINGHDVLQDYGFSEKHTPSHFSLNTNGHLNSSKSKHEQTMRKIRGRIISMVFQEPKASLSPYFRINEQLRETFCMHQAQVDEKDWINQTEQLLLELGFDEPNRIMQSYPHQLSGGESQRIMIALGLISNPSLFIADEPTTALDAVIQYRVVQHLHDTILKRNIALLFISHNLALINRLVDYVIVMFSGKIVEMGPKKSVISPKHDIHHPYTELLLKAVQYWDEEPELAKGLADGLLDNTKNSQGCRYSHRCLLKNTLSKKEQKRCLHEEPPLQELDRTPKPHQVACWKRSIND